MGIMTDEEKMIHVQILIRQGKWNEAANFINDQIDDELRYILIRTVIGEAYRDGQSTAEESGREFPRVEGWND